MGQIRQPDSKFQLYLLLLDLYPCAILSKPLVLSCEIEISLYSSYYEDFANAYKVLDIVVIHRCHYYSEFPDLRDTQFLRVLLLILL